MSTDGRLIIIGAGGFGREIFFWAEDCHRAGTLPPVGGFLDDAVRSFPPGYDLADLGSVDDYQPQAGDQFVMAVASPRHKRRIAGLFNDRGGRFATLVHPTCTVVRTAVVGEGVVMCPQTMAMPDSRIERFVTILNYSGIGHDSVAGEFTTLSSLVDITGEVTLEADVFIGAGARVLPGLTIGQGATIGAGATVVRSVKPGNTVYVAPPKTLKLTRKEG